MIEVRRSCRSGVPRTAWRTGLGSEERLRRAFRRCLGMTPREYHERYHEAAGVTENWPLLLR